MLRILLEGGLDLDLRDLIEHSAATQPVQRAGVVDEVYEFMADRLRGLLLERTGTTAEMIDAVLAGRPRSPVDADARLRALQQFLLLPEAAVLTAINKRIVNILRKAPSGGEVRVAVAVLVEPAEIALHRVLADTSRQVMPALEQRRYPEALQAATGLRAAVDDFFEEVMVMDENQERRHNRLALLRDVQGVMGAVADLSRLPG